MLQLLYIFLLLMVAMGSTTNPNSEILFSTAKSSVSSVLVSRTQAKTSTTHISSHTLLSSTSSTIKSESSSQSAKSSNKSKTSTSSSSTKATSSKTQAKSSSSSSSKTTHLSSSSSTKSGSSTTRASTHSSNSSTQIKSSSSSSVTNILPSSNSHFTTAKTTSSTSFSTTDSSSVQPSFFTSITATNVTSVSSCYQLPTPTSSLLGVETDIPQSDGSILSLLFYFSPDGSTVNYISGATNDSFVLFDLSASDQLGIWVDEDPFLLATPGGLSIFGPNCTWETIFDIPNFYTQLSSIFSLTSPAPTKRNKVEDLTQRQSPPQFVVYLNLDADCDTWSFETYSPADVFLYLNQIIPCTQYPDGTTNELEFVCQQPGATLTQAACENTATKALNTVQSNHWWQFITSSAHKINTNTITTFIDQFKTAAYLLGLKWVTAIQDAIPYRTPLDIANDIDQVGTAINAITPTQVASLCALNPYTGAGSASYSFWLQIGQTVRGYPQLLGAPFHLTSVQEYTIAAELWVTPGLEDISVRCATINDGSLSPGLLCNNAKPCMDDSVCSPGQMCLLSECCTVDGFLGFCVNPTTCNSD